MKAFNLVLVVILAACVARAQDPAVVALVQNNSELLTTLNNYFGCAKWNGTSCEQCSQHYFFNRKGICCQVKPQCRLFNQDVGICEACYQGYGLINDTCTIISSSEQTNPGCSQWNGENTCLKCSIRYYMSNGVCTPVSENCRTWESVSGVCTSCYGGFALNSAAQCVLDPHPFVPTAESLCKTWVGTVCSACAYRAHFDAQGVCQPVSDNCNTWDPLTGKCFTCFAGFSQQNGVCTLSPTINPSDLGCKIWDWNNQICLSCSQGWVFNLNKVCVAVSDNCKTSDANGLCTSCYSGYDLTAGSCLVSPSNTRTPLDLGCSSWDWNNNKCLKCSNWFYANSNGLCVSVSSLCQSYDSVTGACLSCFQGYHLANNNCQLNGLVNVPDAGCQKWDWKNLVCLACSKNWVFAGAKNQCTPVSDQCLSSDANTGECLSCYAGYNLNNGKCIIQDLTHVSVADQGCAEWNWPGQICLTCSNKWFFNGQGKCVPVSDNCKTNDPNGNCLSCYQGYQLSNGVCSLAPRVNVADIGCGKWDWNSQVCLECSKGFVFKGINGGKICVAVSGQCSSYDANGACTSCFKGYDLVDGVCQFSASNNAKPSDSGCAKWDWDSQVCLQCSTNWVFNSQGVCVPVSDQCKSWDASGACSSCWKGYTLLNGVCHKSATQPVQDVGCGKWDWDNQVCLECSKGFVFKGINGGKICVAVSGQCSSYDANGACTSCFKGYDLVDGVCQFSASNNAKPSDSGCGKWDWDNQVCLQCSTNWVFNSNNVCVPVSDQCKTFGANGACTSCFKGYDLVNGACQFSSSNNAKPSDSGCGKWDWDSQVCLECSKGFVFKGINGGKICVAVSGQCSNYDANGACTSCFKGYDLVDGVCQFSASNNAKPSDSGCAKWDWDSQVCLQCSTNWVFNSQGVCVPVSDQCKSWDASGACSSCWKGYTLLNGVCHKSAIQPVQDVGCGKWDWDNQVCLECSKGFVFKGINGGKICVAVSGQCSSYDVNGACTSCFKGYDLVDGVCQFSASNNAKPSDSGCGKWDWDNQVCLQCSTNWVFNSKNVCVPVSDQCKTFGANGACTSCFKGYDLVNGACQFSASNNAKPSDSGCGKWDWDNQVCLECSKGFVFKGINGGKICVAVSDQCSAHDANGACTSCFKGYDLVDGVCQFSASNNAKPSDSGCGKWDWDNQVCLQCSTNWVFKSKNVCVPVSDQCKAHDANGACTSCFKGYDLVNGVCQFSSTNNAKPSDSGCAKWDWDNKVCLECSKGFVFKGINGGKICVAVSDQCSAHDANGACTSCFKGYDLVNGVCQFSASNNAKPSDSGCAKWDWDSQVCLQCSTNWVFNSQGVCVPVSDQCKSWDASGACSSCWKGYTLLNGVCHKSATQPVQDVGCGKWDWDNQVCLECSKGFVFKGINGGKICVAVSDLCKTYDANGACTSCFKGYDLVDGVCQFSASNNAKPSDSGCGKWDWDNQVCLQCSKNWVFNSKKVCVPVDDFCSDYNTASGNCTSCFPGFILNGGKCVQGNPLCKSSNGSGACTSCFTGYVKVNSDCIPISKLASIYLYYAECCPEKLALLKNAATTSG